MSENMQVWLVFGTIAFVIALIYVLLTVIKQKMLAHRLELLAEDIHAFGRSSLTTELQRCDFCRNTSHVHLWSYGNVNATKDVLICYLCASRMQKLLDPSAPRKGVSAYDLQSPQRNEQPFDRSRGRKTLARR